MTTAPVFLVADLARLDGVQVVLDGPEGRHAAGVRRLAVGERLDLVDGAGCRVRGVVASVQGREALIVDVLERLAEPPRSPRFVVVQALPKGDRGELACELMTEAGVDEIVPWAAARCVTKWAGDRGQKALTRWRSTVAEASKQARRAAWPVVSEPATTAAVAGRCAGAAAYVLHEDAEESLAGAVRGAATAGSRETMLTASELLLVVGPEGGIDAAELAALTDAGAVPVRLGPEIVRTSTAGVLALAVLSAAGRWA